MSVIERVIAREILDSRGRPTVWCSVTLTDGVVGAASVPSGASTGRAEALELRDGDTRRYGGLGCRQAVANVNGPIAKGLARREFLSHAMLDEALLALDGTPNKAKLGANAILAVSLAFARAQAAEFQRPLYRHLATILEGEPRTLPRMTINLFSGGKHAGGQVCIQDVLVVPTAAATIDEGLATTYAVYQAAAKLTQEKYGARALKADEGGLAPPFPTTEAMLADAVESIKRAGFEPGRDVALAVDVASSHFYEAGAYHFDRRPLTSKQMIDLVAGWLDKYPIVSLEDALSEDDWDNWPKLRAALGSRALTLGDDFLCTNPQRIRRAIDDGCANALLLKVNQIGSLTEAAQALKLARSAGWKVTVSARSGETEDNWLADLAVGWSGDQIKVGSITQSERLAKYNRLLEIEAETRFPIK
ncbi:MAG: phosphopyruvate hydratase [Planctomycetales bacterium]|nr:phosphopyruvate hydratase [Planctomycetales bacterium]MBN8627035.1 phosphopyruvate hydratase [Planctomycetota bacterium]